MPTPKPRTNTPGRKRRMLGWTFITLGVLVAAIWLASGWWSVGYSGSTWGIGVRSGNVTYIWEGVGVRSDNFTFIWAGVPDPTSNILHADYLTGVDLLSRTTWWLGFVHYVDVGSLYTMVNFGIGQAFWGAGGGSALLLLWPFPLLLWGAGIPFLRSGILARRRAMGDKCKACGYDLAGLPLNAKCPECAAERVAAAP